MTPPDLSTARPPSIRPVRPSPILCTRSSTTVTVLIAARYAAPVTCTPRNKCKRMIKQNCTGFKFKPYQVNDSSQSNQGTDHLISQGGLTSDQKPKSKLPSLLREVIKWKKRSRQGGGSACPSRKTRRNGVSWLCSQFLGCVFYMNLGLLCPGRKWCPARLVLALSRLTWAAYIWWAFHRPDSGPRRGLSHPI
jgi:hypothetical protein